MRPKFLYAIILVVAFGCHSSGQQKLKTVDKNQTLSPSSSKTGASEIIQKFTVKTYPDLKPGDTAPDAVKIDADYIENIINGVCIIRKGDSQAMIDIKGNFIIPWGKYKFERYWDIPFTALLLVSDVKTNLYGFINTKGQVVIPLIYGSATSFNSNKLASVADPNQRYISVRLWIDTQGNTIPFFSIKTEHSEAGPFGRNLYNEPIKTDRIVISDLKLLKANSLPANNGYATGFYTRAGKLAIRSSYLDAADFSDGLAAVAIQDQFKVLKWGYIDPSGRLAIPYTYQIQPGNFHHGLALVKPVGKTDFDFAYIDKKAEIKIKIGKGDGFAKANPMGMGEQGPMDLSFDPRNYTHKSLYTITGYFVKNYAFWNDGNGVRLLDTAGNFHTLADIAKDPELHADKKGLAIRGYDDLGIRFYKTENLHPNGNNFGIVDHDGNVLFPANFGDLQPDYYGPFAIAAFNITNSYTAKRGIINQQGVFLMVIKEKSTF